MTRIALLTTTETDLLSARASGADYVYGNPAKLDVAAVETRIDGADLIVFRFLGGKEQLPATFTTCTESGLPLVVLGGQHTPDATLMELSSVPMGVAAQAHHYFVQGGVGNLRNVHAFLSDTVLLTGDAFEPEKGTAWELGYKWDAPDGRLNASVSAFRIQKDNVLSTDPDNPDFSIATGRVRSQGVEADLAGDITPQVRLTASAAFIDAKVTRDTSANRQGKRFNGVPRVSGSLFALYHDQLANGSDYGVGAGLVHVGDRPGTATDSYRLPAYTTVNLSSYWQFSEPLRLTFNVDNLFDKTYYTGSLATFSLQPGLGRLVSVGVQYRF